MREVKGVKGTKDIYGEDAEKYIYVSNKAEKVFSTYGYQYIKTPIFEETELFQRGIGEGTDVVEKEMYTFMDKGDRSITLRPENTASVVRTYLEHKIYIAEDVSRFFYNGSMFRYERPQKGRQREFNQIGVEVLGESSPILDAEVIAMSFDFLRQLKISDLEVHINSVGNNESRDKYRTNLINFLLPIRANLCPDCQNRLEKNPLRVLDCKVEKCKELTQDAPSIIDSLSVEEKSHYENVKKYLTIFGIDFIENPKLVRGLDYYSSTVYEIITNKLGSQGTVLGGGRYDNLLKQLGNKDIPAFGFAAGVERIMMLLDNYTKKQPDIYIAWLGESSLDEAVKISQTLRNEGLNTAIDYNEKGMKSHMKKADKLNVKYCIIIGEDEIKKNVIILKDFENRIQKEISFNQALREIKNIL